MDANGTRFHLLLGEADWTRCRTVADALVSPSSPGVRWDRSRNEVTLQPKAFRFIAGRGDQSVTIGDRRGAARDRFGNWYWIAPDRGSILVRSVGTDAVSVFWPAAEHSEDVHPPEAGGFQACPPVEAVTPLPLQGLAITDDHYLVAGISRPGGLLIFDLYSGGSPRQQAWPIAFEPFDLAAREGGGVWILDRAHRCIWQLDRRFEILAEPLADPSVREGDFAPVDGSVRRDVVERVPVEPDQGWPVPASDPIAIEPLSDGRGVLVLESDGGDGFARIHWLEAGLAHEPPVSTRVMLESIEATPTQVQFRMIGHDFALGPAGNEDQEPSPDRLYVAPRDGNQAFAFDLATGDDHLTLVPVPQYFPMRLFGGRALVVADGDPWYDSGEAWVRLMEQRRPRYVESGELRTPVFDGGVPGCVWHRLMLDACIPPSTEVEVYSRASDDWRELTLVEWLSPAERQVLAGPDLGGADDAPSEDELAPWRQEPRPYLRANGSELPYLPRQDDDGRGTWELLFQQARGRYVQLRLVLIGDGRATPRLGALRAWYPRFSYLDHYLPAVYREDIQSASFLDRFLANTEGMLTAIEDRMAAAQILFDVAGAPPETITWLGEWFGVALDPTWEDHRRRLFLRHAMEFFALRGTRRGLELALRLALDECVDERLFADALRPSRRSRPVRIIERFRSRRTARQLLGDVTTAVPVPRPVEVNAPWQPSAGAAELHRRYREAFQLAAGTRFPLSAAGAPAGWRAFAERTLGFVPEVGGAERVRWQQFVRQRYPNVAALNQAHGTGWGAFDQVLLPDDAPSSSERPAFAADWRGFLQGARNRERQWWQDFLARRYRSPQALNAAWKTRWPGFADVGLFDRVPADGPRLADWFQFEDVVLGMQRTAHRFTVMLPVPPHHRTDTPAQRRRLAIARMVLELEKPAHTVFDLRFYWAIFRLGEARLGDDTLIDLGSRAPELMAPMILGEGYLAEAFLAAHSGRDAPERLQVGRERLGRSTRLGGP